MLRAGAAFLLLATWGCSTSPSSDDIHHAESAVTVAAPGVTYDHAIAKSIHNAYDHDEPLIDQLVYHRARSVELDIHSSRQGNSAPPTEWFVFHEDNPFMRGTSCQLLSDCLGQLAAFHRAFPEHDVITVWIDFKSGFSDGHQPADLDAAFSAGVGRDNIVAPADLGRLCPGASLRASVTGACHFPTLRELRGKFLFATTGGSACDANSGVSRYGGPDPRSRIAFIAPDVNGGCTVQSYDARPNVVFFNMPSSDRARASEVKSRGLVARVWGLNSESDFNSAKSAGAVHLATDKVSFERDPWSRTHGPQGFPFSCEGCSGDHVEPGAILGLRAKSGDQWSRADSGLFALESDPGDSSLHALVSTPSSHVETWAKACLVARASDAPTAENVALCRPFDAHPARLQIRKQNGADTTSIDAEPFERLSEETTAFVRLEVKQQAGRSNITAQTSHDGVRWVTFATTTLDGMLPLRGVSVSSHGSGAVKALFGHLVRERNGQEALLDSRALERKLIGAEASGDVFDGVSP